MSDVRPTTFIGATSPDASALLPFVGALLAGVAAWFVIELSRVESIAMDGKFLRYGKGSDAGPWGPHSAPIDWCEPNYAVHSHVAEWNNTLSCLAYILVALLHARSSTLFAFFVFMTGTTSATYLTELKVVRSQSELFSRVRARACRFAWTSFLREDGFPAGRKQLQAQGCAQ